MASKKRNGLSKRELASQVVKPAVKPIARPKSGMNAQGGFGSTPYGPTVQATMAGPTQPGKTVQPGFYNPVTKGASPITQRSQAAKAQKSSGGSGFDYSKAISTPNSGLTGNASLNGQPVDLTPSAPVKGGATSMPGGGGDGFWSNLFSRMGKMYGDSAELAGGGNIHSPEELAQNRQMATDNTIGIPGVHASNGGFTDMGGSILGGNDTPFSSTVHDNGMYSTPGQDDFSPSNPSYAPFSISGDTNQAESLDNMIFGRNTNGDKQSDPDTKGNGEGDANLPQYQVPKIDYRQQQNDLYGGGDGPVETPGATTGNRSGRGSGNFGTGKGIQGDDEYIKELRKSYSSNGGEKWLRKQFEELISQLDPTYAQMQQEGTDALNAQLNNENTKLASVMNANNTGDSEQRAQLMAGQQRDTSTALGNLLAKLSQNKAQDVSGYKVQQAEAMGKLQQNKQQDARALLEKIQAYKSQQAQAQGAGRVAGPAVQKNQKLSRNDVFNWTEDALSKGYSWQEIADNAKEQGIGTETGGYLDQLLNQANKQNRYR